MISSVSAMSSNKEHELQLLKASEFLIQNFHSAHANDQMKALKSKVIDDFLAQIWNQPKPQSKIPFVDIRLKKSGIHTTILILAKEKSGEKLYEYWMLKSSPQTWSDHKRQALFYLTVSNDETSKRKILDRETKFTKSRKLPNGGSISFNANSLELRYFMEPWHYQKAFPKMQNVNKRVLLNDKKQFKFED